MTNTLNNKYIWIILMILNPILLSAQSYSDLYHSISTESTLPSPDAFEYCMAGLDKMQLDGAIPNPNIVSIIDMGMSANEKRLWIIDIHDKKVIHHSLVAHGRNSGDTYANEFSNKKGSHQTSLGFYVTGETYYGKHGLSLKLHGMEKDINSNALERNIVLHGAKYVSKNFIHRNGRLGRSFGCPAVPIEQCNDIIATIANGSCMFIYYPSESYTASSQLINFGLN